MSGTSALAAADGRLDESVRLGGRRVDLPVVLQPERSKVDQPVMEVRQDHPHLLDLVVTVEDGLGHDPDRRLDRRAVVVRKDLEEGRPNVEEDGVEIEVGGAVAPDGGHLRRHQAVVGLGQRRVPIAREASERRARRLHDDEVLDAGLDRRGRRGGSDRRDAGPFAAPDERIRRGPAANVDGGPLVALDVDRRHIDLRGREEVLGKCATVLLERPVEVLLRERVGRVLHGVGRDDVGVVAIGMRGCEVALESDRHGQVPEPVTVRAADHADEADGRLAVAVRGKLDHAVRFAYRARAMSTTASSARWISASRSAVMAASKSGSKSTRDRPATKTQYRNPNCASYAPLSRSSSAATAASPAPAACSPRDRSETADDDAPSRGCASISSICSSGGIEWAISRARSNMTSTESNGRASARRPRKPRAPSNSGATAAANAPGAITSSSSMSSEAAGRAAITGSPATSLADEPVEDARGHETAVFGSRAHVIDRLELGGEGLRGTIGRFRRRGTALEGGFRGRGTDRCRGNGAKRESDAGPRRDRCERGCDRSVPPTECDDDLADRLRAPGADLPEAHLSPGEQRDADAQQELIGGERGPPIARPELAGRHVPLAADGTDHEHRVRGKEDGQGVAGR